MLHSAGNGKSDQPAGTSSDGQGETCALRTHDCCVLRPICFSLVHINHKEEVCMGLHDVNSQLAPSPVTQHLRYMF